MAVISLRERSRLATRYGLAFAALSLAETARTPSDRVCLDRHRRRLTALAERVGIRNFELIAGEWANCEIPPPITWRPDLG